MNRNSLFLATAAGFALWGTHPVFAEENRWKTEPVLKTHTVAAWTGLSGPGRQVPGLPMTYDMSLFEWNWGGRQSLFNGSGITTNSNFPLAEGEALSTNTDIGVELSSPGGAFAAGLQGEAYALAGDRTVGRVFGEELPWDNFDRFNLDLDRGWLRYKQGPGSIQLIGGNLPAASLPEFTRKAFNQLRLGSLVWRPPITNASYFEKEDRKLEEGRHPVRGGDLIADYEYADQKHLHLELFSGRTKPTPIGNIDRLSWGGRLAADLLQANLGLTFIRADGDVPRPERQNQWALDGSWPVLAWLTPYGAWVRSSYTRGSANLDGTAAVGGIALKGPAKTSAKIQYQWVGENYDLIGTHKVEHYPSNLRGLNAEAAVPIGKSSWKGAVYHLQQMETNTRTGDTIFGDSYFPALANSKPGTITMWKLSGESGPWRKLRLKGYVEHAHFRKDAASEPDDIDKQVFNFSAGPSVELAPGLSLDLGLRHVVSSGRWQAMRFHSRQEIPELSLNWRRENLRMTLLYNRYEFVDSIADSAGINNYAADQLTAEVFWKF